MLVAYQIAFSWERTKRTGWSRQRLYPRRQLFPVYIPFHNQQGRAH